MRLSLMVQERDDDREQGGSCVSRENFLLVTLGPEGLGYGLDYVCLCVCARVCTHTHHDGDAA